MAGVDALASGLRETYGTPSRLVAAIDSQCHPKQLQYIRDTSSRVAAICSRKAGKTGGNVRRLVKTALSEPESMGVYSCQTIEAAFAAIWDNPDGLPAWLSRNRVPCKVYEEGIIEYPNGSLTRVTGINSRKTADVWRSIRTNLFELDEGQAWDDQLLRYVIGEVIPATQIVRGGQIYLSGTPDRKCRGYFHDVTTGRVKGWSVHKDWTWRDNPHLLNAQKWMDDEKLNRGLTESDPAFRREFNGEWVGEESMLCYRFEAERNTFSELPVAPEWTLILGVDQGYEDLATFTLGSWHSHSPVFWIREVYGEQHCLPTRYAEIIHSYQKANDELSKIVMDCGALGKPIAEMLRRDPYNLNIIPAVKQEKRAAQQMFNDALRTGLIKADPKKCGPLIRQWQDLQVDEDGDEDQSQPNDYCDSALYAFRHASAHLAVEPPKPRIHPGRRPPEDPEVIAARMLQRAEERAMREKSSRTDEVSGLLGELEPLSEGLFGDDDW